MSLLAFIHAISVTLKTLLRKAIRRDINYSWEVPDKEPLEERVGRLENDLRSLKLGMTEEMHNLKSDRQGDRSRIKRLEDSHSDLKEDKKVLHKRVITLKESLGHRAKVEVGEGILRRRRQPGKKWSNDEISQWKWQRVNFENLINVIALQTFQQWTCSNPF